LCHLGPMQALGIKFVSIDQSVEKVSLVPSMIVMALRTLPPTPALNWEHVLRSRKNRTTAN
jgi:hypothetical protein